MRIAVLGYESLEDAVAGRYETVGANAAVFTLRPGENLTTRTVGRPWVEIDPEATDLEVGRALCDAVERHLRGDPPAPRSHAERRRRPPDAAARNIRGVA